MKHNIVAAVLLGFSVFACKNTEIEPEYMISLDETSVSCEAGADELTVSLTCNGDWTLSTDDDDSWCEASAYKGSGDAEITFTVEPNPETDKRIIWYEFRCEDKTVDLRISQDGHVFSVSADPKELTFSAEDNTAKEVTVTSSDDWTLEVKADWCTPSRTSGKNGDMVSFTVKDYSETEKERTTTAVFSCGDKTFELEITQNAKGNFISVEPKELVFSALGESYQNVTVTSSADWILTVKDDWCRPYLTSGKNGTVVSFSVEKYSDTEKDRSTIVTFICKEKQTELKITQEAKKIYSISVEPKELIFYNNKREIEVQVISSDNWRLEIGNYSAIRSSIAKGGEGKTTVVFTPVGFSTGERETYAEFICGDVKERINISIHPYPEEKIIVEQSQIRVCYLEQDATLSFTAYLDWTLSGLPDWCSADVTSGSADEYEITLHFDTNFGQNARQAEITLFCDDKQVNVQLYQDVSDDPFLEFEPTFLSKIINSVDTNKDGHISKSEAEAVTQFTLFINNSEQIHYSFDEFPNLFYLSINAKSGSGEFAGEFDLSNHTDIESIYIRGGSLETNPIKIPYIKLNNCKRLTKITVEEGYVNLGCLDVSDCSLLQSIIFTNGDSSANSIDAENMQCDSLKASGCSALRLISIDDAPGYVATMPEVICRYVDVSKCFSLRYLPLLGSDITNLNVSECSTLTFHASQYSKLENLKCNGLALADLNISNNRYLRSLSCDNNNLTVLDLSNNTALSYISIKNNPLEKIIVKKDNNIEEYLKEYSNIIEYVD